MIRAYVQYVVHKYTESFGNQHVLGDIISYLAKYLTSTFPSLRDSESSPMDATFVSIMRLNGKLSSFLLEAQLIFVFQMMLSNDFLDKYLSIASQQFSPFLYRRDFLCGDH